MPARKRPAPEDTVTARLALLDGLARDADIFELVSELAHLHPRNNTFPGEVFLHVAADALNWCRASRADPLPLEGLRERFLPERTFRDRQNTKLQYAVLAAAALHGGTEPDLLDEVAWWQTDDFWQYALFAAVAYIRAAASRAGVSTITTTSGRSGSGHLTLERPIIAAARRAFSLVFSVTQSNAIDRVVSCQPPTPSSMACRRSPSGPSGMSMLPANLPTTGDQVLPGPDPRSMRQMRTFSTHDGDA